MFNRIETLDDITTELDSLENEQRGLETQLTKLKARLKEIEDLQPELRILPREIDRLEWQLESITRDIEFYSKKKVRCNMYFPTNKWIDFEYETDRFDCNVVIRAQGWIGDRHEREYENATVIELLGVELDWPADVTEKEKDSFTEKLLPKVKQDALEYFKVNFVY